MNFKSILYFVSRLHIGSLSFVTLTMLTSLHIYKVSMSSSHFFHPPSFCLLMKMKCRDECVTSQQLHNFFNFSSLFFLSLAKWTKSTKQLVYNFYGSDTAKHMRTRTYTPQRHTHIHIHTHAYIFTKLFTF